MLNAEAGPKSSMWEGPISLEYRYWYEYHARMRARHPSWAGMGKWRSYDLNRIPTCLWSGLLSCFLAPP